MQGHFGIAHIIAHIMSYFRRVYAISFLNLRIDNRRCGPFWCGRGIMETILSIMMYYIHYISLLYYHFDHIKHVKITWTDTIQA